MDKNPHDQRPSPKPLDAINKRSALLLPGGPHQSLSNRSSGVGWFTTGNLLHVSCDLNECIISSAVSTVLRGHNSACFVPFMRSTVDTAICAKPCGDLAGQLL
jgi:hypothetical protein